MNIIIVYRYAGTGDLIAFADDYAGACTSLIRLSGVTQAQIDDWALKSLHLDNLCGALEAITGDRHDFSPYIVDLNASTWTN